MILDDEPAVRTAAALNNAEWCDAVCRAHGLEPAFGEGVWSSARRTPPYYPDAVTLSDGATAEGLLSRIDTDTPGCSVKDSFARLDLGRDGFEVLFEAQWIHRPAGPAALASGLRWERVTTPGDLAGWEEAWAGGESTGLFRPGLLVRDIAFLAGHEGGRVVAGAVANLGAGVVGLSNVFAVAGTPDDAAWSGALTAVAGLWPGVPVVGYESGDDLATAVRHGFAPAGPLRVWLHTA